METDPGIKIQSL